MIPVLRPVDTRPTSGPHPADIRLLDALRHAGLPTDDLDQGSGCFAAAAGGEVIGYAGLDGAGPDQMIRSVVVLPAVQARGHGRRIVAAICALAIPDGAIRLRLLTASAERFFAAVGWQAADRQSAPAQVRASARFAGLCPAAAVLMCRPLA